MHQFGGRKENFLWKSYCVNFKCNLDVFLNILMYSFWEVWLMAIQILCILGSLAADSVLNLFCSCLSVLGVSPYSRRLVHRTGCSWLLNYITLVAQWKHPANDYILLMFVVLFAFLYVRNINIVFWRVKISLVWYWGNIWNHWPQQVSLRIGNFLRYHFQAAELISLFKSDNFNAHRMDAVTDV